MLDLTPVLVLAIIFGSILGIIYLGIRKKERMAMLEKGVDASVFFNTQKSKNEYSLKYGLLLVGIACGILLGNVLSTMESFADDKEAAYFSMIFLFGGLALVIYYFLAKRKFNEHDKYNLPSKE
jgi:ABC-type Fe3+-siderophore transport system permease subunit